MADKNVHYKKVAASKDFRKLLEEKRRFIVPMTIFFFLLLFTSGCYILLHLLNTPAIGAITWAWLFALTQFVMTWVLCGLYAKSSSVRQICKRFKTESRGDDE